MKFFTKKSLLFIFIFTLFIPKMAQAVQVESNWENINIFSGWGERTGHSTVSFKDRIWFFGGLGQLRNYNDVWVSDDFKEWEKVGKFTNINGNRDFTSLVYDDRVWIIGGKTRTEEYLDEVWYSNDMINWVEIDSVLPWDERAKHSSVLFNDEMWIIGGKSQDELLDDVWHSSDGINWLEIEENSPWSERYGHTSIVFDSKIWIFGGLSNGEYLNDIWSSEDGKNWIQVVENSDWSDRYLHEAVNFDDAMWIFGGLNNNNSLDDAWRSEDGVNWELVNDYPVERRYLASSVIHDEKLALVAGYKNADLDDLWFYDPNISDPVIPIESSAQPEMSVFEELSEEEAVEDLTEIESNGESLNVESALNSDPVIVFSDLSESTAYKTAINYLAENNIVNGYPDGSFRPSNKINRAEFLKIIMEAKGYIGENMNCFSDVNEEWFASYICTAKELAIIDGYSDGTFRPADQINVVEALKITLNAFTVDLPNVSSLWYDPFTTYATANGLMLDVFSDYSYEITRGEMAELIYKMLNLTIF